MVQLGKYSVGYLVKSDGSVDTGRVSISEIEDNDINHTTPLLLLPRDDAREIAQLINGFLGIDIKKEICDQELLDELRRRGYSGKLELRKEIDL